MKKKSIFSILTALVLTIGIVSTFTACEDPVTIEDPIASFQFDISETNYLEVTFTNYSTDATTYSWDFGDETGTSTEKDPVYTYTEVGTYTVVLTASNDEGTEATYSEEITITDPLAAQRLLVGDNGKDWRLIREGTVMGIGPNADEYTLWWALENDGKRPCVFNQTWTFNPDGSMVFDDGGYMWGDNVAFAGTSVFETCFEATAANMVNGDGVDVSAWLSGTHAFEFDPSAGTLTLTGTGAWLGLVSKTAGGEVTVPQASITYDVTLTEGDVYDLMVVSLTGEGFYWQFNYVSYHDWANEPDVVSFLADFDFVIDGFEVTFTNKSKDADSYSWDFGDGGTSTETDPVHTYTAEGAYDVVLTATSGAETKDITKTVTISLDPTTLADAPTEDEANVISIYSDAYTSIDGVNLDPDWGQATVTQEIDVLNEKVLKVAGLTYQGIDFAGNMQDVSAKTTLHIDVYCTTVTDVNLSVISDGPKENAVKLTTEAGVWKSFDIPLSSYTVPTLSEVIQLKFDDAGSGATPTIFVDNIYFY